jgi:hypothetical protein
MSETVQIAHQDVWEKISGPQSQDSRQELVEIYARIVKYVAGRMAIGLPHYVDFNDLISAGLLGLIQAIDNFDHTVASSSRPTPFPASAVRFSMSCAARTGSPAACAARPSSSRKPTQPRGQAGPSGHRSGGCRRELSIDLSESSIACLVRFPSPPSCRLDADASSEDSEQSSCLGEYLADPKTDDIEQVLAKPGDEATSSASAWPNCRKRNSSCSCSITTRN